MCNWHPDNSEEFPALQVLCLFLVAVPTEEPNPSESIEKFCLLSTFYCWTHALLLFWSQFSLCVQAWNQVYQVYKIGEWTSEYIDFFIFIYPIDSLLSSPLSLCVLVLEGDFNIKYVIWGDLSLYTKLKAAKLRGDFHVKAMVSSASGKSVHVGGLSI